jgi:ribosomal protein S18 acetylase RimI-like enzyme
VYTGNDIVFLVRPKVDNDQMDRLRAEGFEHHVVGHDWTAQLDRSLLWIGAFDGDRLVGFVNLAWDGGVHAFMLDTAVAEQYRRRGIGTRLVREAIDAARRHGGLEWVHVDSDEVLMRDFYGPAGFSPVHAGTVSVAAPRDFEPPVVEPPAVETAPG